MSLLDFLLPDFVLDLIQRKMTPGEAEVAYNLTVIYGLSILSMVVLYKLLSPKFKVPQSRVASITPDLPTSASTLALIKSRRSIATKDLNGSPLSRDEVEFVLEAANWAPTHHRNEPWRYRVLEGPEAISGYLDMLDLWYSDHREEISQDDYTRFQTKLEGCKGVWVTKASHVVVIGMVRQAKDKRAAEWEEIAAVACSVQNMHLALTSIPGTGGFWSSHTWCREARDSQQLRDYMGLTDPEDRLFGAFVMGRVDTNKSFKGRREDWRGKVQWQN